MAGLAGGLTGGIEDMWTMEEYNAAMAVLCFSENSKELCDAAGYSGSDVRAAKEHLLASVVSREDVGRAYAEAPLPRIIKTDLTLDDYEVISDLKAKLRGRTSHFVDFSTYPVDRFGLPFSKYTRKDYALELVAYWKGRHGLN